MKLKEYLDKKKITPTEFAAVCGWNFSKMYRLYQGGSCTLESAYILVHMTDKEVSFTDLLTDCQIERSNAHIQKSKK